MVEVKNGFSLTDRWVDGPKGKTFAKELMEELVAELTDLKGEVDKCAATIATAVKSTMTELRSE